MAEKNGVAQDDQIQTWGGGSTLEMAFCIWGWVEMAFCIWG